MKIAIAGYGIEGEANFSYWSKDPENDITIVDESITTARPLPVGVKTILGEGAFNKLDGFDLVIRTAGLAPRKIKTNGKIWSGTNEFFDRCEAEIIGVTGSKGKGTTSSLIASILRAAGKKVHLVGNIGLPSLDQLDKIGLDDIVVYELSSFQLWDLEKSPKTAVVLFIEKEHMDVHKDMDEYVSAKANITMHQSSEDLLIYNSSNEFAISIADKSVARKVSYPSSDNAHESDGNFHYGDQLIGSVSVLKIKGRHNIENAIAAIDAVWQYTNDSRAIIKGLSDFSGLPHRLAHVRSVNGVDYYDDSIATTPSSAIAAIRAFSQEKVIILGGSDKGSDFTELAREMTKHQVKALLIGDQAEVIAESFGQSGFKNYEIIKNQNMQAIVKKASEIARPGGVVLLSPAAASFDMFKNYADRGEQFEAAVNSL